MKEDSELVFDLIGLASVFQVRIVLEMNDFWYVDVWHNLVSYRKQFASVDRVVLLDWAGLGEVSLFTSIIPLTHLKKNIKSRYSCQYVRGRN